MKRIIDNFIDPEAYKHFLLTNGDKIEANIAYTKIYKSAKKSIYVIDNYIELKTLELLTSARDNTQIIIFAKRRNEKVSEKWWGNFLFNTCFRSYRKVM
ncbi:hypothetical protein FUSO5_11065 [Fusobacterium necrophorum BFTR-1]|nr:hypothetical protein [Fusobacterium necrophorum]KDE61750.1 hypothetical protein FUSO5_11065 [Fusobacterium necrophorum BFTR-1]